MDAGIADTINRRDVALIVARLDSLDDLWNIPMYDKRWWESPVADKLMSEDPALSGERAWLVGSLAGPIPNIRFDGEPAGGDWDNLLSYFRAAILARRDPQAPHAREAETRPGVVV